MTLELDTYLDWRDPTASLPAGQNGRGIDVAHILARCDELGIPHAPDASKFLTKHADSLPTYRDRIACTETLQKGDAGLKDLYYIELLEKAQELMATQSGILDFTNRIAKARNQDVHVVRRCISTMRTEFIIATNDVYNSKSRIELTGRAGDFIDDHLERDTKGAYKLLDESWIDRLSVASFYAALFSRDQGQLIGAWFFEEIPIFLRYYRERIQAGSELDRFSRLLLEDFRDGLEHEYTISKIQAETGHTTFDRTLIPIHRNLLAYGDTNCSFYRHALRLR